jgi:hypothetical protein
MPKSTGGQEPDRSFNRKKEETDLKSVSSFSVPRTELFSEPFLRDLELIWLIDSNISVEK